ncbi:flagellar protein FliS [Anaerocolumna jejuensis DSM 15929]|uniref:Flagellar protein FliS n=1 Tax=Anaerocolumna jejuensis DSM 15929 TaxID=1121322 RepID=A0A1M7B5L3_9FIRM|nr:flagellar export chaperone FliS [Anaerocolumna jejuensis]SHL50176.1 flagellar protein FliS [Anaerocolumna jejuensis DSM 15929]
MQFNAATAYQNNKINTATPAELTLMLYEGMIKFCNIAIMALDEENYERVNTNILKTEKILNHLRSTLEYKYPVAKDFENIYQYIYDQLVLANVHKDKELLEEMTEEIRGMRDTWKEVIKSTK